MYARATSYSTRSRAETRARLLYDRVAPFHARSRAHTLEDAPSNVDIRKRRPRFAMHDAPVVGRLAPSLARRSRVSRAFDRARRAQNFSFAPIDALRDVRALATTCARRRVSRGRRDEDSTSAARARRGGRRGRGRVRLGTGFRYVYHTPKRPCTTTRKRTRSRWAPRGARGRSVGRPRPVVGPAVARGRPSCASRARGRPSCRRRGRT